MAIENTYEQVYNIKEDEGLPARVALVVCVLLQRGLFIAGFSITKELLTIHYSGYNANRPVWDIGFFEQVFASEPLLTTREKIKGVFVSSSKNMVVPDELYGEAEAKSWLKRLFYIEARDLINILQLENDKARYVYATPVDVAELIKINFKKALLLPLAAYHFDTDQVQSLHLQCCISSEQVVATLHNYSQLLWHKAFDYSCAEDIAYEIRHLCKENYIDAAKLNVACNAFSAAEYDVINELTQYFPGIKAGNGRTLHAQWDPAIFLAAQLLECVL